MQHGSLAHMTQHDITSKLAYTLPSGAARRLILDAWRAVPPSLPTSLHGCQGLDLASAGAAESNGLWSSCVQRKVEHGPPCAVARSTAAWVAAGTGVRDAVAGSRRGRKGRTVHWGVRGASGEMESSEMAYELATGVFLPSKLEILSMRICMAATAPGGWSSPLLVVASVGPGPSTLAIGRLFAEIGACEPSTTRTGSLPLRGSWCTRWRPAPPSWTGIQTAQLWSAESS